MLNNFTYLPQGLHQLNNEVITIPQNNDPVYLLHDNISNVSIYTGLDGTGSNISGFTLNQDVDMDYKYYLLFDATTRSSFGNQQVYCNYTSTGDVADSELFSELRSELIRLANLVDSQSSTSALTISSTNPLAETSNYSGSTVSFRTNKWLKKNQNTCIKVFSDSNRTNEITGTVSMGAEDEYIFTPSSPLLSATMHYVRIYGNLQAVDGSQLANNYDFAFMTA